MIGKGKDKEEVVFSAGLKARTLPWHGGNMEEETNNISKRTDFFYFRELVTPSLLGCFLSPLGTAKYPGEDTRSALLHDLAWLSAMYRLFCRLDHVLIIKHAQMKPTFRSGSFETSFRPA